MTSKNHCATKWGNNLQAPAVRPAACGGENEGSRFPSLRPTTPRTKSCPFTPLKKDRFPHPNEQKSLATTPRSRVRFLGALVVGNPGKAKDEAPRLYGSFKGRAPGKSELIGTPATRRSKKQAESVSFPPRSPKARDRGHPDCGGDCTRRPGPPAGGESKGFRIPMSQKRDPGAPFILGWSDVGHPPFP